MDPKLVPDSLMLGNTAGLIMDRALPFMERAVKAGKPFLSVIWLHNSHLPIIIGDEFKSRYSEHPDDFQHYYGVVSAMDDQMGRLREKLRELGVAENTMIWFTSDNGPESTGEVQQARGSTKGLRGRKRDLYEGGVRVPGLLEWPAKVKGGKVVESPAMTTDYLPTILAALNIDLPNDRPYDGVNLMPVINGKETRRNSGMGFVGKSAEKTMAYIDDEFKIYTDNGGETWEMYHLVDDVSESKDISEESPEKFRELIGKLEQWNESVKRSSQGKDYLSEK